jgi:hypothetical protein
VKGTDKQVNPRNRNPRKPKLRVRGFDTVFNKIVIVTISYHCTSLDLSIGNKESIIVAAP